MRFTRRRHLRGRAAIEDRRYRDQGYGTGAGKAHLELSRKGIDSGLGPWSKVTTILLFLARRWPRGGGQPWRILRSAELSIGGPGILMWACPVSTTRRFFTPPR